VLIHVPLVLTCLITLAIGDNGGDGDDCSGALDAFLAITMLLSLVHGFYIYYYFRVFKITDAGPPAWERAKQLALYHIPTAVYMVVFIIGLIWAGLGSIWAADCSTGKGGAATFAVTLSLINGFMLPCSLLFSVYLESGRQDNSDSCIVGWCLPHRDAEREKTNLADKRGNGQASEQQAGGSDSFSWCRPSKDDPHAQAAPPPKKRGATQREQRQGASSSDTMPRGVVTALPEEEEPRMVKTEKGGVVAYHSNPTHHVGVAPNHR